MLSVEKVKNQCKNRVLLPLEVVVCPRYSQRLQLYRKHKVTDIGKSLKNQKADALNYHGMIRARYGTEMMDAIRLWRRHTILWHQRISATHW